MVCLGHYLLHGPGGGYRRCLSGGCGFRILPRTTRAETGSRPRGLCHSGVPRTWRFLSRVFQKSFLVAPATRRTKWGVGTACPHMFSFPKPRALRPTPDPSLEGNWPTRVALLLGGNGGTAVELSYLTQLL